MLNQTLFLSIVISFFVYESDLAVNVIPPRLLVYCKPILLGSLILFTDINNKKERRKHMNQWIETETIATEVNLNKDFHFENKTTENNKSNKNDYLTELANKILNNEVKYYPQTY